MKITRIDVFALQVPLGGASFFSSQAAFTRRKSLLVRIETDDGLAGWGEGGQYGAEAPVAACITGLFGPFLIGQDPLQPEVLWERMYSLCRDFGRTGTMIEAISAIDIALWDLCGKARGAPVWSLLGGAFRDRVRAYATGFYYAGDDPSPSLQSQLGAVRAEAERDVAAGFDAVKVKIGLMTPRDDLARVAAVRDVLGPERLVMVDANHAYRAHTAIQMAKGMERLDVYWFEEPVAPEDFDGYLQVKAATTIAIAGGECEHTRYGFARWLAQRAFDIAQPDPCCAGGISETRKIATMAGTFGVHCLPHVWGSGIATAAGLHVLATLAPSPHTANPIPPYNEPLLEWDSTHNPLRTDLLTEPFTLEAGKIRIPDSPGLGVEVNDEVLQRYLTAQWVVE